MHYREVEPCTYYCCCLTFPDLSSVVYMPAVQQAFEEHQLQEHELGAALSFHYNTGAISTATWVEQWCRGEFEEARNSFMNWRKPEQIISRREKERDLFFDSLWSSDGLVKEFLVAKPDYSPDPATIRRINVAAILEDLI